eukprot:TRINITY_DN45943_c0_g1_i1.p1 TRINITY_DN45943_c0_g1~~TRINITY_DN45943_c0_g1_i1.p1  ORF type:complete len:453 (+),score=116.05 TRINITY_DN45943_c0_g1_i1:68-1360(+)
MAEDPAAEPAAENPENFKKWLSASDAKLSAARLVTRDLLISLRKNQMEEAGKPDAGLDQVVREQKEKKERVYGQARAHMAVIESAYENVQSVERSITQTSDSITQLTHERYKGFAHLQICELRQELREKRPAPELFQDAVTDALASEHSLLEAQRQELQKLEAAGKTIVADLTATRALLSRHSGERRINILHDISSINDKVSKPGAKKKSLDEENNSASPKAENGSKLEEDAEAILGNTQKLLHRFSAYRSASLAAVERCRGARNQAKLKTEESLTKRIELLAGRKLELEGQLMEVSQTIVKAERELESSYRKLAPSDKAKADKLQADTEMLDKLRRIRDKLTEDLRCKATALEIDNTCKRVNAAKAGGKSVEKEANLIRSNSAPNLAAKKRQNWRSSPKSSGSGMGESMNSAGESKSLKAGAAAGLGLK